NVTGSLLLAMICQFHPSHLSHVSHSSHLTYSIHLPHLTPPHFGRRFSIISSNRCLASVHARTCTSLGSYIVTSDESRTTSRSSLNELISPHARACTRTLPIAVASTGPVTTTRLQASAVN